MTAGHRAIAEDALLAHAAAGGRQRRTERRPRIAERAIRLDDNRYVLREPLQQTSSTATWAAWDAPLERMVALRVFRCPTDDFLAALARDVHACSRVKPPARAAHRALRSLRILGTDLHRGRAVR